MTATSSSASTPAPRSSRRWPSTLDGRAARATARGPTATTTRRAAASSRTWRAPGRDTVAVLRGLWSQRLPDLAQRVAAIAVTGQGDGTWLIDDDGDRSRPRWLWLDSRAAGIVDEIRGERAHRGASIGAPAPGSTPASRGRSWPGCKRNAPEMLSRAATAFHCKDWLYFKLTGERATDPLRGRSSPSAISARARYVPAILDAWIGHRRSRACCRDASTAARTTHPLSAAAAAATGLPEGMPVALGYVDVALHRARRAASTSPAGAVGCSIIGSTGMHMRLVPDADAVVAERRSHRLHHAVPGAGRARPDAVQHGGDAQHRLAASIVAREACSRCWRRRRRSRSDAAGAWTPGCSRRSRAPRSIIPTSPRPASAGRSSTPRRARSSSGSRTRHRLPATWCAPSIEGLAFAARDCYARDGPAARARSASPAAPRARQAFEADPRRARSARRCATAAREEAGAAGAAMMAAVAIGAVPGHAASARGPG